MVCLGTLYDPISGGGIYSCKQCFCIKLSVYEKMAHDYNVHLSSKYGCTFFSNINVILFLELLINSMLHCTS